MKKFWIISIQYKILSRIFFFFLNEEKINIFRFMHIGLFIKVIYWIQILLKRNYFVLFSLQSHFFDELSKFFIL